MMKTEEVSRITSGNGPWVVYFETKKEGTIRLHLLKRKTMKAAKIEALEQARIRDLPHVMVVKNGVNRWCVCGCVSEHK